MFQICKYIPGQPATLTDVFAMYDVGGNIR